MNLKFGEQVSHIVAESTSGKVHVLLSKTEEPRKDSIWSTIERPALEKNPKVSQIVRLNLEELTEEVIYQASGVFAFFKFSFRPEYLYGCPGSKP